MGLSKNVASQKVRVFAFADAGHASLDAGEPVTGDAANITGKVAKDWGTATAIGDTNPTEVEDGYYLFDLTQAETNANVLDFYPKSSTAGVQVIAVPGTIYTQPQYLPDLGINSSGHVSRVTLADTTTTNTDMRGTDSALTSLGSNAPSGWVNAAAIATDAITADKLAASAVAKIEAALLNEGDGQALIDAIVQAIDAADISTNLTVALIRDAILDRALSGNHDTAGTLGAFAQQLDAAITSRLASSAAPTNFSSLGINASGHVSRVTLVDTTTANTDMRGTDSANTTEPPTTSAIASALLAAGDVDGFSLEETLKLCLAALAGKLSGASSTSVTIRAADDSKARITATVDSDGNRTAITLDGAG